ncbi:MAG TPA: hypothetical protein VKT78_08115 [Fimbriimonadaceae bacterium]|nr:hypothetical protein [Fimbriimonadaceae bacterium]
MKRFALKFGAAFAALAIAGSLALAGARHQSGGTPAGFNQQLNNMGTPVIEYHVLYYLPPNGGYRSGQESVAQYHVALRDSLERFLNKNVGWEVQPISQAAMDGTIPMVFFRRKP